MAPRSHHAGADLAQGRGGGGEVTWLGVTPPRQDLPGLDMGRRYPAPPPVDKQIDTCANTAFPRTTYVVGHKELNRSYFYRPHT